jgi:hypothetical protein
MLLVLNKTGRRYFCREDRASGRAPTRHFSAYPYNLAVKPKTPLQERVLMRETDIHTIANVTPPHSACPYNLLVKPKTPL